MEEEMRRYKVETDEKWRNWCDKIPALQFDSSWDVRIIPPFSGALVRFVVSKNDRGISVYFDAYSRLGWMCENDEPIPYWEIYTSVNEDFPKRYLLGEENEMMAEIRKVLEYE